MSNKTTNENRTILNNLKYLVKTHKIAVIILLIIILGTIIITPILINSFQSKNQAKVRPSANELNDPILMYSILKEITIESGDEIPSSIAYFDAESAPSKAPEIKYYLDDKEVSLNTISYIKDNKYYSKGTNKYKVIIDNNEKYTSTLNVIDKTKPIISLKDITITSGKKYEARSFVNQYNDNSSDYEFTAKFKDSKQSSLTKAGTYNIAILVCDKSNNCTEDTATLVIKSENGPEPEKTFVKKITKEIVTNTDNIKYGLKRLWYVKVTYNTYSDGSKVEISRGEKYSKIDRSGFNGTTSSIRSEASQVRLNIATTRSTIIKKTNEFRSEGNLAPLAEDKNLTVMANIRAIEIAYSGKFDHNRPNGKEFSTVWDEYEGRHSLYVGENLAADFKSDLTACNGWKNSKSHYENIMNERFTKIGVGKYTFNGKTYWVQLFEE